MNPIPVLSIFILGSILGYVLGRADGRASGNVLVVERIDDLPGGGRDE